MQWERGKHWDWQSPGYTERPTIWAMKTESGWKCQFAHGEHGLKAEGRTRDDAADILMSAYTLQKRWDEGE